MEHGSLFSGIGGFDLAAEWMGWNNRFHCEWNEFGQKVLKHYWPKAESYGDITKTDFTIWRGKIDILTGGFPCQPYSSAGKRLGKEDDRHLWPEMLRVIGEISPRYVVVENVRALLIGMEGWYSTKCKLNWKLRATKSHRFYFQLSPSMRHIGGIGYGLLPTVTSVQRDHSDRIEKLKATGAKTIMSRSEESLMKRNTWELTDLAAHGLLPTPTATSDAKGGCTRPNASRQNDTLAHAMHAATSGTPGTSSQLNPRFVMEMMGFPPDWTELPFLNGETNQSKLEETQ